MTLTGAGAAGVVTPPAIWTLLIIHRLHSVRGGREWEELLGRLLAGRDDRLDLDGLGSGRLLQRLPLQVHQGEAIGELVVPTEIPAELLVQHGGEMPAGRLTILVDDPDGTEGSVLSRAGDDDLAAHVPD